VHIIDGVLTPSWVFNGIGDRVLDDSNLSVLQTLLTILRFRASSLFLRPRTTPFLWFAPYDTIEFLLSPEGKAVLIDVLKYHVLLGVFTLDEFVEGSYATPDGRNVTVTVDPVKFNCFD
jgi:hypothetical protein